MRYAMLNNNRTNNIGDQIQSIAARRFLPHIDELVDRDRLSDFQPNEHTRLICNGWFTHNPECFDFSEKLEPLLISFHMTPNVGAGGLSLSLIDAAKHVPHLRNLLTRHGPVGARDLHTLQQLKDFGVPAYFSGCLTLTLVANNTHRSDQIVLVDVAPSVASRVRNQSDRDITMINHSFTSMRAEEFMHKNAERLLALYAQAHMVITSRLHVALPCLALGTSVILVGDHLQDPRFSGLKDLFNHCDLEQFEKLPRDQFENPEPNPSGHLVLRNELIERVKMFVNSGLLQTQGFPKHTDSTASALARHLDERLKHVEETLGTVAIERDGLAQQLAAANAECDGLAQQLAAANAERERLVERNRWYLPNLFKGST